MKWRWWLLFAGIALAAGVGLGLIIELGPGAATKPAPLALREINVGTPVKPPTAENVWKATDRLTQKRQYTTADPLALRVVSAEPPAASVTLNVRLLREDGSVYTLEPETITVAGGTGGFCCWHIETPGSYKWQVFRTGQGAPVVVPITIVAARQ